MSALALAGPLTEAETLSLAAALIDRWGLCVTAFEAEDESMDPSGAIAVAVGLPADVWQSPHWTVLETDAYQLGFDALYALVNSIGRWNMPPKKDWIGEDLAEHIAWWLEDVKPSAEQVIHEMRAAAESLSVPAEQIEAVHA